MTATGRSPVALGYLSLFTSLSTLLCCALPSLLVFVGLGATVASLIAAAPWLITLSLHKGWLFTVSGLLIVLNFAYVYRLSARLRPQRDVCAVDGGACGPALRLSLTILWVSAVTYAIGFVAAFMLLPLIRLLTSH